MSSENIVIKAEKRTPASKGSMQNLRKSGLVPGVLYGKKGSTPIAIAQKGLPKEHTKSRLVSLELEGANRTVLMREVQVHPLTHALVHIDLQEVEPTDVVRARIPLEFEGLTAAQQKEGMFKILVRSLEVRGPANQLPRSLKVDVSRLKIDESVKVGEIGVPEGIRVRVEKTVALASLVKA